MMGCCLDSIIYWMVSSSLSIWPFSELSLSLVGVLSVFTCRGVTAASPYPLFASRSLPKTILASSFHLIIKPRVFRNFLHLTSLPSLCFWHSSYHKTLSKFPLLPSCDSDTHLKDLCIYSSIFSIPPRILR